MGDEPLKLVQKIDADLLERIISKRFFQAIVSHLNLLDSHNLFIYKDIQ